MVCSLDNPFSESAEHIYVYNVETTFIVRTTLCILKASSGTSTYYVQATNMFVRVQTLYLKNPKGETLYMICTCFAHVQGGRADT